MNNNKINIGTLIHGTLRDEDLLQAFSDELARINKTRFSEVTKAGAHLFSESANLTAAQIVEELGEYVTDVINDLMYALNEYAPPHTYFGAIEGDGSDFGFWPDGEPFELCDTTDTITPTRLANEAEWIDNDCGVIVNINDHGNVTAMKLQPDREVIWSAV